MKEDLKKIFYMGLGAMSLTNEKAKELKEELLKKGEELYEKGAVANEELKHNINEAMKERITVVKVEDVTKDSILENLDKLSDEDKEEILKALSKKKNKKEEK
jgi:polyhydroxyalkanoate synthesis regulator phasin